jgi:glycyl-tRNA synthetase beta chain
VTESLTANDLLGFFADRLKAHLREEGARHDLIEAVFSLRSEGDVVLNVKRFEALQAFLETGDGARLMPGLKRVLDILATAEMRDNVSYAGLCDFPLFESEEERLLAAAVACARQEMAAPLEVEDFDGVLGALARLQAPIEAFLAKVAIDDGDVALRTKRLRLLAQIRALALNIADFSKIAG